MQSYSVKNGIKSIFFNRELLKSLVIRELANRYRATNLGLIWIIINPLLMLSIYTFVFGFIFKSKWRGDSSVLDFVSMMYCGLIVYGLFSETISKSVDAIVNNPNYVKKVIFPLELLPVCNLLTALFSSLISFCFLLILIVVDQHHISMTVFFAPFVILPVAFYAIGFGWFVAALGVFFRDLNQFTGVLLTILMFLSPVFYSSSQAPAFAQHLMTFNPLTYSIEALRDVAVNGLGVSITVWSAHMCFALLIALGGFSFFQLTRPAFADVI